MSNSKSESAASRRMSIASAVVAVAALITVAGYLLSLRFLPFQDVPNHILARAVHGLQDSVVYERGDFVFTYRLATWLLEALGLVFDAKQSVELVVVLASVATPVMLGSVAVRLDLPRWPCVLAGLPLIVAFPTKMGFMQSVLAAPFCLWSIALAIDVIRAPNRRRQVLLACAVLLMYVAHAIAVIPAALCIGAAWLHFCERDRLRALARLAVPCAAVIPLVAWDLFTGALTQTAGTEVTWQSWTTQVVDLSQAMNGLLRYTLGLQRPSDALLHYPFMFAVVGAMVWIFLRRGRVVRRAWIATTIGLLILAMLVLPTQIGLLAFLTQRMYVYLIAIGILAACDAARALHAQAFWGLLLVASISLIASLREITDAAKQVDEIASGLALHRVTEKTLPVRLAQCGAYQTWDPERHLWAYALAPEAPTPYLFAYNRYHVDRYRGEYYRRELHAPSEGNNGPLRNTADCSDQNRARIRRALLWPGFPYVLAYGDPEIVKSTLRTMNVSGTPLAAGMILLRSESESGPR